MNLFIHFHTDFNLFIPLCFPTFFNEFQIYINSLLLKGPGKEWLEVISFYKCPIRFWKQSFDNMKNFNQLSLMNQIYHDINFPNYHL